MMAPVESIILPVMRPRTSWAYVAGSTRNPNASTTRVTRYSLRAIYFMCSTSTKSKNESLCPSGPAGKPERGSASSWIFSRPLRANEQARLRRGSNGWSNPWAGYDSRSFSSRDLDSIEFAFWRLYKTGLTFVKYIRSKLRIGKSDNKKWIYIS